MLAENGDMVRSIKSARREEKTIVDRLICGIKWSVVDCYVSVWVINGQSYTYTRHEKSCLYGSSLSAASKSSRNPAKAAKRHIAQHSLTNFPIATRGAQSLETYA